MSLKFGQIRLLVPMATDRVIMEKKRYCHFFLAVFHPILFILAGNDDMHESSEVFKIRPDLTTDSRKNLHGLIIRGSWCCHFFSAALDWILSICTFKY